MCCGVCVWVSHRHAERLLSQSAVLPPSHDITPLDWQKVLGVPLCTFVVWAVAVTWWLGDSL